MIQSEIYFIRFIYFLVGLLSLWALGCGDDGNGQADPENTKKLCTDEIDNDGDGAVDCDDLECGAIAVCKELPPEWRTTWVTSQQLTEARNNPPDPGLVSNTLRQVLQITIGGEQMRFTFSNEYAKLPLTIVSAGAAATRDRSAIVEDSKMRNTLRLGADEYVEKPFELDVLLGRVRELLATEKKET